MFGVAVLQRPYISKNLLFQKYRTTPCFEKGILTEKTQVNQTALSIYCG